MKNHRPRLLSPRILAPLMALSFSPFALAQAPAASDTTPDITAQHPTHPQVGTPSSRDRKSLSDTIRSIRDLRRIRPISAQGVRADVLAYALSVSTGNDDGRQVAVPWSQAMPGGSPLNDSSRESFQLRQNLEGNTLQIIQQVWRAEGDVGKGIGRYRTGIQTTLPQGPIKPLRWVRNGTPLLSLGTFAFTTFEIRPATSWGPNFKRSGWQAYYEAVEPYVLKQGQVVPFNQVLHEWKSIPYNAIPLQLIVLPGERQNQFRACWNIGYHGSRLVCNTWQVPHSWNYLHTLDHIGPYLAQNESDGMHYFRYRP